MSALKDRMGDVPYDDYIEDLRRRATNTEAKWANIANELTISPMLEEAIDDIDSLAQGVADLTEELVHG